MIAVEASAIKISYGGFDRRIIFQPNLYKEMTFHVSDAEKSATVPITLKGKYAHLGSVEPSSLTMRPGETKDVKVSLKLPAEMPEGIHNIEVAAKEVPLDKQAGAFILMPEVGVALRIINTDKEYACSIPVFNGVVREKAVSLTMNVVNDGRKEVQGAYGEFVLYNAEGERLTSFNTPTFSVAPLDSKNIGKSAPLKGVEEGYYRIKGIVHCGGERIHIDKQILFRAHELEFNEFRIFKDNGFLNIEWDVENEYMSPVRTWAFVWFYENGKEIQHYSILPTEIPPMGTKTLKIKKKIAWLDIPPGTFDVKGVLHLKDIQKEAHSTITFLEEELSKKTTGGGFGVVPQDKPKPVIEKPAAEPEIVMEETKTTEFPTKLIVRIVAGLLILVLLSLLAFKFIFKK